MIKKNLKNKSGMVIPVVIVVFVVLMTIGIAAINLGSSDYRHSIYQNNKAQAFYLAKSGAQTFADYLIEKSYTESYASMMSLIDDISDNTSDVTNFEDGEIIISVERRTENNQEKLRITSQGTYRNVSDTVTVSLILRVESDGGDFNPSFQDKALVTLSDEESVGLELLNGAFLDGDVMTNATKENSIRFSGGGYRIRNGSLFIPFGSNPHTVIQTDKGASKNELPPEYEAQAPANLNQHWNNNWAFWKDIEVNPNGVKFVSMGSYPSATFPEPIFPDFPDVNSLNIPANPDLTTPWVEGLYYPISEDSYYNSIIPSSSRTITVDMAGGDRVIRVGTLNLTGGNLELENIGEDSTLYIYVENSFAIGSSRTLNSNGLPENVQIYYLGSSPITIDGAANISGNIFIKEGTLTLTAGGNMKGNIVSLGSTVNISGGSVGNPMAIYAPNALVEMSGSAQVKGSIIASRFRRLGGGNPGIIFTRVDNSIPGDFFDSGENNITIEYDLNPWN